MKELSSNHMQHSKDETKIETHGSDYPVNTLDEVTPVYKTLLAMAYLL